MTNNQRIDNLVIETLGVLRCLMGTPGYTPSAAVIKRANEGNEKTKKLGEKR